MRVLVSVFAPIYWTTVLQRGAARNGYSFTHGHFRQESQLEFDTGEIGGRRTVEKIKHYTSYRVQYVDLVHMQQQVHIFKNKLINPNPINYTFIFTTVTLLLSTLYITRHLDLSLIFKDTNQSQHQPFVNGL